MGGKQYLVIYGKKVVFVSKPFVNEEERRIEYEKAQDVYKKLSYRKCKVIVETVYGIEVKE